MGKAASITARATGSVTLAKRGGSSHRCSPRRARRTPAPRARRPNPPPSRNRADTGRARSARAESSMSAVTPSRFRRVSVSSERSSALRGVLGVRERADRELARHRAASEAGARAVRKAGLDAQLRIQNRREAPAVQRVHEIERGVLRIALVHADVREPEIRLRRFGRIHQQHAPAALTRAAPATRGERHGRHAANHRTRCVTCALERGHVDIAREHEDESIRAEVIGVVRRARPMRDGGERCLAAPRSACRTDDRRTAARDRTCR